jgi:hypothetical protein
MIGKQPPLNLSRRGVLAGSDALTRLRAALPTAEYRVEAVTTAGTFLLTHWTLRDTVDGKPVVLRGRSVERIADREVVASWVTWTAEEASGSETSV